MPEAAGGEAEQAKAELKQYVSLFPPPGRRMMDGGTNDYAKGFFSTPTQDDTKPKRFTFARRQLRNGLDAVQKSWLPAVQLPRPSPHFDKMIVHFDKYEQPPPPLSSASEGLYGTARTNSRTRN